MKKRKWTRRKGKAAIPFVSRIRGRNNRLWMGILTLAVSARPKKARRLIAKINENDQEISRWLERL